MKQKTMQVFLPYGSGKLAVSLEDSWDVTLIEAGDTPSLPDPLAVVGEALRRPIAGPSLVEFIGSSRSIGVVINDGTRPTPTRLLLIAIQSELPEVPDEAITLFNATGTHRANTLAELEATLGAELVGRFRIVQNDARDETSQLYLGDTRRGHPIWINRRLMECERLILTGFIEPHFFAGFSGGGKAILPGMAGLRSVLANHGPAMIADPDATWGVTRGNPIWEECAEVAERLGHSFLLNVALNRDKAIRAVFAGEPRAAHAVGCAYALDAAMVGVDGLFEIVLTSNSGFPLDQNLYQAVKGMSAAATVVRTGGAIVIAAECRDGAPEGSNYLAMLREAGSPEGLLTRLQTQAETVPDQWQAQIQAQIQRKAEVHIFSSLAEEVVRQALFQPVRRIEETLAGLVARYGPGARIAVLPEGPQTIPFNTSSQVSRTRP